MVEKEIDKYIVIKREHLESFFNYLINDNRRLFYGHQGRDIPKIFNSILDGLDGKDNDYIVCNQDEPYAELVWQTILQGERIKLAEMGS